MPASLLGLCGPALFIVSSLCLSVILSVVLLTTKPRVVHSPGSVDNTLWCETSHLVKNCITLISVQYGRTMHSCWDILIRPSDPSTYFQYFLYYSAYYTRLLCPIPYTFVNARIAWNIDYAHCSFVRWRVYSRLSPWEQLGAIPKYSESEACC